MTAHDVMLGLKKRGIHMHRHTLYQYAEKGQVDILPKRTKHSRCVFGDNAVDQAAAVWNTNRSNHNLVKPKVIRREPEDIERMARLLDNIRDIRRRTGLPYRAIMQKLFFWNRDKEMLPC